MSKTFKQFWKDSKAGHDALVYARNLAIGGNPKQPRPNIGQIRNEIMQMFGLTQEVAQRIAEIAMFGE